MAQFNAMAEQYTKEQDWLDFRSAQICAVMANCHRDPKKGKAFKVGDFMPKREAKKSPTPVTGEQMLERVRIINEVFGGTVK